MTGTSFATAALWSYGLAAVGYLVLAGRMAIGFKISRRGALLLAVTLVTAVWALGGVAVGRTPNLGTWLASNVLDAVRYALWFGFLGYLLAADPAPGTTSRRPRLAILAATLLVAGIALGEGLPLGPALGLTDQRAEFAVRLGLAILGLSLVEQLYRRVHPQARWGVKPLCIALAAVFGFDLFLFADALLFGRVDTDVWIARAVANVLVIPLVAIATARNRGWTIDMHLSRRAVVQSTALLGSGVFLLLIAGAGYIVRYFGGDWGRALQIELLFAAVLLVALIATSGRFRARLKVFVSKHFFSYRYDYREEWLRFTGTLATDSQVQRLQERAIMALADLVESPAGALWLGDEHGRFRVAARWNLPRADGEEPRDGALPTFLERSGWVVSMDEWRGDPDRYEGLAIPAWLADLPEAWLVVPLVSGAELLGFVVLATPRAPIEVDWEVLDLLKAAGRAAASYLAQMRVTEALLEARKFEAFNRMSAFVVHDLKNLVAQLSLLLANAARHRDNPEFQRDMLGTVEHAIGRMNALLLQLRTGTTPVERPRPVDLSDAVLRVCGSKVRNHPSIELDVTPGVVVLGHEDRLERVIGHLVQNALDAIATGGKVAVRLTREGKEAEITVGDNGVGMSPAFVSERLFKPFQTTKTAGMGIGVYESSQYVTGLGGRILVDSREGVGTSVRVLLPIAEAASLPPASLREMA